MDTINPQEELDLIIDSARNNFVDFQIAVNHDYQPSWHHEVIGREMEHIEKYGDRDYKVLILSCPPRHGKTKQCSIDAPAWFLGRNPNKEIVACSYSAETAQDFGTQSREIIQSEEYQSIFPGVTLKEDSRAKAKWNLQKNGKPMKGGYTSVGVGGPLTGRGANVLIIDDPVKNREEADSLTIRNSIWSWFTSTAFTRLEPGGVVVVIMTRWHQDDLAGRILADKEAFPRVKLIEFPAIADAPTEIDGVVYRNEGEPLWPSKYDINALNLIKNAIGPYDWSALYQQRPVSGAVQEFDLNDVQYIAHLPNRWECHRTLTIDTAVSKKATADYTAFAINYTDEKNNWNIEVEQARLSPNELIEKMFQLHDEHQFDIIGIESTIYLHAIAPFLREEMAKRNKWLNIKHLSHNGQQKELRIRGLLPRYKNKSIFHVKGKTKELEEQMIEFPKSRHDDALDALAYQLQVARAFIPNTYSIYEELMEVDPRTGYIK